MYFPAEGTRWSLVSLKWLWGKSRRVAVAAVVVMAAFKVHQHVKRQHRRKRWVEAGKDVVVLHMFPRGRVCPNLSPFVLKLETYLRMTDIKYEVDYEEPLGYKGKSPWITLNGENLVDSQFIIEHLRAKFNKNLSGHLTSEQKASAHAIRTMLEANFLWTLGHWRFVLDKGRVIITGMNLPFIMRHLVRTVRRAMKKALWIQGMGRHTNSEIEHIARQDLAALSAYLGEKDFLTGDKPIEEDCAVFGMMCQVMYCSPGSPYLRMLENDFPNVPTYVLRVREKFWPDWNAYLRVARSGTANPPHPSPKTAKSRQTNYFALSAPKTTK